MAQQQLIDVLRSFLFGWQVLANSDGVPLQDIDVNLVSVLYDLSDLLGVDPKAVLGELTAAIDSV